MDRCHTSRYVTVSYVALLSQVRVSYPLFVVGVST